MPPGVDTMLLASELRTTLARLVRRLRTQHGFSLTQGAVLGRLESEGPQSISELAAAEHVRPQSMAQTVADLEGEGRITRTADPSDGRRTLIHLAPAGAEALAEERRRREGWLSEAIADDLSPDEQETLDDAVALLRRLVDRP